MKDKRQSHTRQAFIHLLIIVCICLSFIREVQQLKSLNEPVADSALSKRHFPFRNTVYLEIFARRNFRELPAELNFRVFIFANGDLTIYIVYIANGLY